MSPSTLLLIVLLAAAEPRAPQGEVLLPIDLSRHEVRGIGSAPVLVVEFSDFKCHACEKFSLTIMPELTREFIDKGSVKVAFVDFPLVGEASYTDVAEAPRCAGRQGKYWEMHDLLWRRIGALGVDHMKRYAAELGLDAAAFGRCLESDEFVPRVMEDLRFANELGLSSRPTFFVGRRGEKGDWRGRYIVGAQSYLVFKATIRRMLAEGAAK